MINSTANKYGPQKKDSWRSSQAESVGSPSRIINTTANPQAMKQDSITAGIYSAQFRKAQPIDGTKGKLVEKSSYGNPTKQA